MLALSLNATVCGACNLMALMPHRRMLQVFREPSVDAKVIVASGPDTILIAFRGTASWANVVSDLQGTHATAHKFRIAFGTHLAMDRGRHFSPYDMFRTASLGCCVTRPDSSKAKGTCPNAG